MAKQFTISKNERLKSRKLIEQLFEEGKSFSIFPFKVFYLINLAPGSPLPTSGTGLSTQDFRHPTPASRLLFGVAVGTRNFKKAVDRNRIKRLTREAYRLQKISLEQKVLLANKQLNIFFIYIGKDLPDHLLVKEKTALILNRLIKVVDENTVADS